MRVIVKGLIWAGAVLAAGIAGGAEVRHDAPDGVAAVELHRIRHGGMLRDEEDVSVYYVLLTDGRVGIQVWPDRHATGKDWQFTSVDWPAPFSEIVSWQAGTMYPAVDVPELAAGIIVTRSGEIWRALPEMEKSWDRGDRVTGMRWEKLRPR